MESNSRFYFLALFLLRVIHKWEHAKKVLPSSTDGRTFLSANNSFTVLARTLKPLFSDYQDNALLIQAMAAGDQVASILERSQAIASSREPS